MQYFMDWQSICALYPSNIYPKSQLYLNLTSTSAISHQYLNHISWIQTINTVFTISHEYLVLMLPTQSIYFNCLWCISNAKANLTNIPVIYHQYFTQTIKFDLTKNIFMLFWDQYLFIFCSTHLCTILVLVLLVQCNSC